MQINFTGHNIDITPALKNFTEDKLAKIEKHFERITSMSVTFNVNKLDHIAEATVLISGGEIHGKGEAQDMYSAIDKLVEKLDRQLIKHKEKYLSHRDHRDHFSQHDDQEGMF